jgi:hypothetical protein
MITDDAMQWETPLWPRLAAPLRKNWTENDQIECAVGKLETAWCQGCDDLPQT